MKSSKNVSAVLLGYSIVAGFNIWYKFFDENTVNCGIGGDKIQNVLWRAENIPLPKSLEYVYCIVAQTTWIPTILKK